MQQLETRKEIVEAEQKYKRMGKGCLIAQSRRIYRLMQTDVFYVESESTDNVYYVKFKPDVVEYCTCPDNSLRGEQMKCKHLWSIEFAIRLGILIDTDRLPTEAKVRKIVTAAAVTKSYKDDDYSF